MANTSAIWQHIAIPPTDYHLPAAKQEQNEKAYLLTKTIEEFSGGEKDRENRPAGRKKTRQ